MSSTSNVVLTYITSMSSIKSITIAGDIGKQVIESIMYYSTEGYSSYPNMIVNRSKSKSSVKTSISQSLSVLGGDDIRASISARLSTSFINYPGTTKAYYEYYLSDGYISIRAATHSHSTRQTTRFIFGDGYGSVKHTNSYKTLSSVYYYYSTTGTFYISFDSHGTVRFSSYTSARSYAYYQW